MRYTVRTLSDLEAPICDNHTHARIVASMLEDFFHIEDEKHGHLVIRGTKQEVNDLFYMVYLMQEQAKQIEEAFFKAVHSGTSKQGRTA